MGFSQIIEAGTGDLWMADAMKDSERWVVKAEPLSQAFPELWRQCEEA